jgi:hypothetical protein
MAAVTFGQILLTKKIISQEQLEIALDRQVQDKNKYLGQILCEMGVPQSKIIKALHFSSRKKQFGQILTDLRIITPEQLRSALTEQKRLKQLNVKRSLGAVLTGMEILGEDDYLRALSIHFIMPIVPLKNFAVSDELQKIMGDKYCLHNKIIILDDSPQYIAVAIGEPNLLLIEEIEKTQPPTKEVRFYLAKNSEIVYLLAKKYDPYSLMHFR